jgi:signal transduction histidine kinase
LVAVAFDRNIFGYEPGGATGARPVDVQITDVEVPTKPVLVAHDENPRFNKGWEAPADSPPREPAFETAIHGRTVTVGHRNFRFDFLPNASYNYRPHWVPWTVLGAGALLVALATCAWASRDARRLATLNSQLRREIAERTEMQRLMEKLLEFREQERELVAHEIHDGFVQDVVGAQMFVEGLAARMSDHRSCHNELQMASQLLTKAIEEGRRLISDLKPVVVDELGLVEAVKALVREEEQRFGLSITFRHSANLRPMPTLVERALYRIIQESLTNVKRHSGAHEATVTLIQDDEQVVLEVKDAGRGFDPLSVADDRFGLLGMQERARLLHGTARIRSAPGQGTCVTVEMPLQPDVLPPAPHFGKLAPDEKSAAKLEDTIGPGNIIAASDDTVS